MEGEERCSGPDVAALIRARLLFPWIIIAAQVVTNRQMAGAG
ncbi:hypothetical protein V1282_005486 [Nitrobacteraceae bacterium AZCC 2146]